MLVPSLNTTAYLNIPTYAIIAGFFAPEKFILDFFNFSLYKNKVNFDHSVNNYKSFSMWKSLSFGAIQQKLCDDGKVL